MFNQDENSQENQRNSSLYYVIPHNVMFDKNLKDDERMLYAIIAGLCNGEGYCWASDQWFADKRSVGVREIKRSIHNLEKHGHIWRHTTKDGMISKRRIYIDLGKYSKNFYEGSDKSPSEGCISPPRGDVNVPHNNISFIRNKNIRGEDARVRAIPAPEKISFGKHVKLFQEELEALEKEHGSKEVREKIDEINDYLSSTGKKPYKDYVATIRNWIRREKKSPNINPKERTTYKENKARVLEAIVQLRKANEKDEKAKQIFLTEKEVVRLDNGKRISLYLEPEKFFSQFLELFNLRYSE